MIQSYPQVESTRLSEAADEWRILIRWNEEAPTRLLTISQALGEVRRLQDVGDQEIARRIREAVEYGPLD